MKSMQAQQSGSKCMARDGKGKIVRNPLAGPNRRVNRPKVERDRTKYRRKDKHKGSDQE